MKRLVFHVLHNASDPLDPGRVDRIIVEEGAVLIDSQSGKKHTPMVSVSALVGVEFEDDSAVTPTPDPLPDPRAPSLGEEAGS